jgi:superfamily II DNA or RNA helicase
VNLRPYQSKLIEQVRDAYRGGARSVVMQLATGGGKTHTAAHLIKLSVERGKRVAFVAHLSELIDDTAERLRATGVHCGIVQADRPTDPEAPVQICTTQTLTARGSRPPADLVILDECHRSQSPTVLEILAAYPSARLLGLSATPQRGDGRALGDTFERLVCGPSLADLTGDGYLVPARVHAPVSPIPDALGMDPVEAYLRWCAPRPDRPARPTLIFAQHAAHAHEITARIPGALEVLAETDRDLRHLARESLADGTAPAVVTVRALQEGWDCPAVSAVVLCSACSTVTSYLQAIGRGLRASAGKQDCVVVDLRGACLVHGLPADDRQWTLEGNGVRPLAKLPNLRRCLDCHALFAVASRCPLCGSRSIQDPRPVRVKRREFFEASGMPVEKRLEGYRRAILTKLLKAGKPAWLAHRIADNATPQWARNG